MRPLVSAFVADDFLVVFVEVGQVLEVVRVLGYQCALAEHFPVRQTLLGHEGVDVVEQMVPRQALERVDDLGRHLA